jgi:phosphatidylinositol alpha-1,6-mannosyltransferase
VLLTVARMDARERYKGHERVIASLPSLPDDVVYVVLGEGDDRTRLEALARDTGVADRVLFKGGVPRDVLIEGYRMADLYVMPSTGEGFGIAFLEAMASGTPALGLAVAGAADALCDGALGIAATEDGFASALARQLVAGKPDPQALSRAVAARFGNETFTACTRSTLKRLLQG